MDASAVAPDQGLLPAGSPGRLWPRAGLALVLTLAAALRLWRLHQNGFDNEYYAAAVPPAYRSWRWVASTVSIPS